MSGRRTSLARAHDPEHELPTCAGWIETRRHSSPGTRCPTCRSRRPQLAGLVDYLEGLREWRSDAPGPGRERTERLERDWVERPGVLGWLTTTDHKRIGLLYFWTTLVFFAAGGVEALIMRTQLASRTDVVGPNTYDQLFTMHGMTMIFCFIIPMTTGAFGNYLLPLMIGARDMAFPRMNALSYWLFLALGDLPVHEPRPRLGAERRLVRLRAARERHVRPRPRTSTSTAWG